MKIFSYKENSCLNNWVVRAINYFVVGAILMFGIGNDILQLPFFMVVLIPIVTASLCGLALSSVLSSITFYEWDYTERMKKQRFVFKYLFACIIISTLFAFSIVEAYVTAKKEHMTGIGYVILAIPIVTFGFNLCNIVSLYYPIFKDELILGYKIQKKPESWKDNGQVITEEDEVEEIMHRDWGI